jgi:hypothetical protein
MARVLTFNWRVPAEKTSYLFPYFARSSPSAIWDRAAFAVQMKRIRFFSVILSPAGAGGTAADLSVPFFTGPEFFRHLSDHAVLHAHYGTRVTIPGI